MLSKLNNKLGILLVSVTLILSIMGLMLLNGSFAWFANNKRVDASGFAVDVRAFSAKGTVASYGVLAINDSTLEYTVENVLDDSGERKQVYELPLNDPNGISYSQYSKALLICITATASEPTDIILTVETPNAEVITGVENHLSNSIQITPATYDETRGIAVRGATPSRFVTVTNNSCQKSTEITLFSGNVNAEGTTLYYIIEYNQPFIDYINALILDSGNLTSEETKYRNDITFIIS